MDETTTRLLFQQVSADAPPAADVDLGKVVRRAERRRRRRRHRVTAAAAGAVLVLTSAVAVVVTGFGPDRAVEPVMPGPTQGPPLTTAPTEFDPARNGIEAGWLPSGLPYVSQEVGRTEASIIASDHDGEIDYWIRLAARGHGFDEGPEFTGMRETTSVPGPDIGGVPSRWYTAAKTMGAPARHELRWEWKPGAQASLVLDDGPDALDIAEQIAESVHVTETALRLPYTALIPSAFRLMGSSTNYRGDELRTYGVTFEDPATGSILSIGTAANTMTLDFEPNTVINDRPGQTKQEGDSAGVRVRQPTVQFGLYCDDKPKTAGSVAAAMKRCRAVAESIELVADPLKPGAWPDATVR